MSLFKTFFLSSMLVFFSVHTHAENRLHDISGEDISFADLQGKWVLINYWASWCHTCVEEIPELNRLYAENKNKIAIFAVNYDALPLYKQQQLIKRLGIHYPSLKTDPANDLQLGDIQGVPVTFIFNPQGQLSDALYGGQTVNSLKAALARISRGQMPAA